MKKKSNSYFKLNKTNVSKLNAEHAHVILGGNTVNTCVNKSNIETCDPCTTSRYTVDFGSNATHC